MGIFSRGEGQEEQQQEEQLEPDGSEGIEAPVIVDPPGIPVADSPDVNQEEVDAWEDPAPPNPIDPDSSAGEAQDAGEDAADEERRPRGWLEADVERLLKAIQAEEVAIEANSPLTPHFVAAALAKWEGLPKEPSTGAVSAVFDRWVKIGAAVMELKPYRFVAFTEEAKRIGIPAIKQGLKDQAKLDRDAKKQVATDAAKAAAVEQQQASEAQASEVSA